MVKNIIIALFLLVIGYWSPASPAGGLPIPVHAQGYELLPSGEVIDADFLRAGNIIQIDGEIKGDVFLAGGLVTVNGKIDGDLFVFGGKVNINGEIGNSVRVLGGDVIVNGPVGKNVLLLCGNCSVTRQTTIGGSLITAGGNLEMAAPRVGRGFRFFGSRLFLNSEIANEAFVVAQQEFLLGPKASVSGNLKYTGNFEAILEPGATVGGNISYQKSQEENYPRFFGAKTILDSFKKIKPVAEVLGFFVSALIGFVLLGLFPKVFEKVVSAIEKRPYASFGWGILVAISVPVAVLLLATTIVGIPVSLALLILGYLLLISGQYLAAFFLGRKILLLKFGERRGWAIFLGFAIIYFLGLVPVLGGIIKLALVVLSLGAAVLAYKQPVLVEQRPLPFESSSPVKSLKRGRR